VFSGFWFTNFDDGILGKSKERPKKKNKANPPKRLIHIVANCAQAIQHRQSQLSNRRQIDFGYDSAWPLVKGC